MMRLPPFRYRAPRTVAEAAAWLAEGPEGTMILAGGTDLLPNMKRRQQVPGTLLGLRGLRDELATIRHEDGLELVPQATLTKLVETPEVRDAYRGLWQAASQVATPHLRNMATIGGNLCLDTRCNYYDQNYEWRKAIGFCMKKDGDTCWVATSSPRCLAVSSTDTAPMLRALDATVTLVSTRGSRVLPLSELYANDGMRYLTRQPDEILTACGGKAQSAPPNGANPQGRFATIELDKGGQFTFQMFPDDAPNTVKNFVDKAAHATLVGDVFDDAATGQGLLNYFLRAMNCGAITEQEAVEMSGLSVEELRSRSFARILDARRRT